MTGSVGAKERLVNMSTLGAWLLKCDPKVWDVGSFMDDGGAEISDWSVVPNYRSRLMRRGQKAVFWVSGSDGQTIRPGLWGVGWLSGPAEWAVTDIDWDPDDDPLDIGKHGYWLDRDKALAAEFFVPTRIDLWDSPYSKVYLHRRKIIKAAEVFRIPQMSNPSFLTKTEVDALTQIIGQWPRRPQGLPDPVENQDIQIPEPDDVTAEVLQVEALTYTFQYFENRGYDVAILVGRSPGWDIEARKGGVLRRVRVRGLPTDVPALFLSQAEYDRASTDVEWELAIVTGILPGHPALLLCPALWVHNATVPVTQANAASGTTQPFQADFSVRPASIYGH